MVLPIAIRTGVTEIPTSGTAARDPTYARISSLGNARTIFMVSMLTVITRTRRSTDAFAGFTRTRRSLRNPFELTANSDRR